MGFASLIQRITYKVSGRSSASSGLYTPSTELYDYAIGGVPFLSATNDTRPDTEKPVPQRKQQFDNYKDPGEYSLAQWWLRSQTSFVGGAGVTYQDPDTQGQALNIRYHRSIGVDPFSDPDNLTLLHEVNRSVNYTAATSVGNIKLARYVDQSNTERIMIVENGGNVVSATLGNADIDTSLQRTGTIGSGGTFTNLVTYHAQQASDSRPKTYAFADSTTAATAGLWRISDNTGASLITERIYKPPSAFLTLPSEMALTRGSIYVGVNEKLYQLDPNAAVDTTWPATAVASVPSDQVIRSITDGPDAVYVAANNDYSGYIYKSTFDSAGAINGLTQVAVLPLGERINSIAAYIATYMVITTTTSVRVASFTGSGLQYGPQLFTVPTNSGYISPGVGPVKSGFGKIAFYGTRAYVSTQTTASQHDGAQGVMAIDLSTVLTDNTAGTAFNAYSTWVYSPSSTFPLCDMITTGTGRIIYAINEGFFVGSNNSVWIEHATNLISSGYLDTGRCRFNTVEPKLFKYFSIRTPTPLQGDISVALLDEGNGVTTYITYGPTLDPGTNDIATPTPVGPHNWEALRFTLHRGASDATVGAKLDSWQIKALPGTLKQRVITRQFLCFNSEKDKSGQTISGDTSSLDRLTAIRQMCQRGDTVTLQDLVNNISDQVVIDDYQFTMLTSPGPNGENYGGYLTVIMRTVADSVPPVSLAGSVDPE